MTDTQKKDLGNEALLVPLFHNILATQSKTSELFVKSFQYQGGNIATKHLGQIFGFFEIPDTQEDNAYIVNFLASVVKKEYFVNPKRSATDSFEATLHKINLALTELVKQGNTGWLGNLHGLVAVIVNNTFHFSVTGDASILLYRDHQVTCISEGLADKDAALHPLKTFLEISSGALLISDKILLTSPELFTLCEPETLRKNAFRMDKNGFARFVRAALVNELPLGVSVIIDMEEEKIVAAPKKKAKELREESLEKLQNVFSGTSFLDDDPLDLPEEEEREALAQEEAPFPGEYTDQKTGHIYVQGERNNVPYKEPTSWQTLSEEWLRPFWKSTLLTLKRLTKKSRKVVAKQAGTLRMEGKELSQNLWKASREKSTTLVQKGSTALKERIASLQKQGPDREEMTFLDEERDIMDSTPLHIPVQEEELSRESDDILVFPPDQETENGTRPPDDPLDVPMSSRQAALHKFSPHYERERPKKEGYKISSERSFLIFQKVTNLSRVIFSFFTSLFSRLKNLSFKQKMILGITLLFLLVMFITALMLKNNSNENRENQTEAESSTQENVSPDAEEVLPQLPDPIPLASWTEGTALLVIKTEANTVAVTPKSVIMNGKVFPFPADGTIESATYMADLSLLFLWSGKRELVSWSLVDQKFNANTLPLSVTASVSGLGSYLTYLYVLDKNAGSIYRFARTEGGFGEPTSWLKTPLTKNSVQAFVVTDTIRIASDTTLDQYFKGAKEKTLAESNYPVLGLSSEKNFTLGVEPASGKITIWNAEGTSVYEKTFEELKGTAALSYNEADKKLLIAKNQNLVEYPLSW